LTREVFEKIKLVKPKTIFIIADGPREVVGEAELVKECRRITSEIDWECDVLTEYSEINLGCKDRMASGVYKVLGTVKRAIFLEDDCLPNEDFFRFMDLMLDEFEGDNKIGMISGTNMHTEKDSSSLEFDIYLSKYSHIWGWATWANRWLDTYEIDLGSWPELKKSGNLKNYFDTKDEYRYWARIFDDMYKNPFTWDYQWTYINFVLGRKSVVSKRNLITNTGFNRLDATHTKGLSVDANKLTIDLPSEINVFPDQINGPLLDEIESLRYRRKNLLFRGFKKISSKLFV
jgi:hypothetical protein